MLLQVMREVNNYFWDEECVETATFTTKASTIKLSGNYLINQYIAILGSVLNDGVYRIAYVDIADGIKTYTIDGLFADEVFAGTVCGLKIPQSFLSLVREIEEYTEKCPQNQFVSERFADYNYTSATDKNGIPATWEHMFLKQLNGWRIPRYKVRL